MKYALDVFYTPIFMKKNRPAYKLSVICELENEKAIEDLIFKHSTSIGIRKIPIERDILDREIQTITYKSIDYKYKIVKHNGESHIYPEYESAKKFALSKDIGLNSAFDFLKKLYDKGEDI